MAETGELDVSAGPTGVAVRSKGYRLMDLAWGGSVVGIVYIAVLITFHDANAGKEITSVAQALRESNKDVAAVLREQNKESNAILREMARATREQNCLLALPQDRRAANAELCRRISQ